LHYARRVVPESTNAGTQLAVSECSAIVLFWNDEVATVAPTATSEGLPALDQVSRAALRTL
jgi:hypothetical protein